MSRYWLRTDEHEEAIFALETAAEWSGRIEAEIDYWKWVVVALHNSMQGFMILALRGSDGLLPLRDHVTEKWVTAHRENGEYPIEKLDSFLNLYRKVKSDSMLFYVHSKKFVPNGSQDFSIKILNELRNNFVHFLPRSWSLEISGLPEICLDCLSLIEFLGWECKNIVWYKDGLGARGRAALDLTRERMLMIKKMYSTNTA